MNNFINPLILREEIQDFIQNNSKTDVQKLVLKGSPFPGVSVQELATQIEGRNKTAKKLPSWQKKGILFPAQLNLEQSSSEITARYKASLMVRGELIDLTGGFGVDDFYFSQKANQVFHCEQNAPLSALVKHNAEILGLKNMQFIIGDSHDFLHQTDKVDAIYVDPSRRADSGRVFLLQDSEPDVVSNQSFYLEKADTVFIKAAPMLDISAALNDLRQVSEVHIVSLNNECKELLFVLEKNVSKEPEIFCVLLKQETSNVIIFSYEEERNLKIGCSSLQNYLYEPDAAILKGGFFKSITQKFGVEKIHQHSHLYTSATLVKNFPGKSFEIIEVIPFNDFSKSKILPKANVVTRNFHLKPEEIKKKFEIKDGGMHFLFFSTDSTGEKTVIKALRV